jgi:hypothetical protein
VPMTIVSGMVQGQKTCLPTSCPESLTRTEAVLGISHSGSSLNLPVHQAALAASSCVERTRYVSTPRRGVVRDNDPRLYWVRR